MVYLNTQANVDIWCSSDVLWSMENILCWISWIISSFIDLDVWRYMYILNLNATNMGLLKISVSKILCRDSNAKIPICKEFISLLKTSEADFF